jgi:AraC-like DNA-binding protein
MLTPRTTPTPPRRVSTSSVKVLRAVIAALGAAGVDPAAVLAELGVTAEALADDHGRVPFAVLARAWERAPALAGDDAFGLHLAERAALGAFDVFDYAARASATIGEALGWLVRFQRLLHDDVVILVDPRPDRTRVVQRATSGAGGEVPRHAAEAALASWLLRARLLAGVDFAPRLVAFRHPAPRDTTEHRRIFRSPVLFASEDTAMVLAAEHVALPIATSDADLRAVLDRHAAAVLAALPPSGFVPEVRAALAAAMAAGDATLVTIARRLGTSTRTLQRRLAGEGVRFEDLLDALRRELAFHHLADPRLSVAEVGFLLGYADPTAFHRAFRRWADCTPQEYRRARPGYGSTRISRP